jgi:hypothetical protein
MSAVGHLTRNSTGGRDDAEGWRTAMEDLPDKIDHYTVDRRLGSGGMGEVYLALNRTGFWPDSRVGLSSAGFAG